jgi:hypothetical protein
MRCNNGAATPLHFPVAVMPEKYDQRLSQAKTRLSGEVLVVNISRAAPL